MQCLRGCPSIIVLLFYFACLWRGTHTKRVGLCPTRCSCNDETLHVMCESAGLDLVPITLNPEIKELHLARNEFSSGISSFGVYRNLRFLDISHNQLHSVGQQNFQSQHHLQILLLNHNHIASLSNGTFIGLRSLQVLHLNNNLLESVSGGVLAPLRSLETLDLSSNLIESLSPKTFAGLTNLNTLLLRNNKLSAVPTPSFQNLTSLVWLDLGLNSFQTIPNGVFVALKELKKLYLDSCGIAKLQPGAFRTLSSLLILHLHDNRLVSVPDLRQVSRLEEIRMGRNLLVELRARTFPGLGYLKTIDLGGSLKLERIRRDAFADNGNLERLILSLCPELVDLESGSFDGLSNLRHLSLRANGLVHLDSRLFPWDELETLDLRDNPLECDCKLLWLKNLLLRQNFSSDLAGIGCSSDDSASGRRLLLDIPSEQLECGWRDSRRHLIIGVVIAVLVSIAALATLAFRFRTRLAGALKNRWGQRKEPQYQKTSGDEEILQVAQLSLKDSPVTEL